MKPPEDFAPFSSVAALTLISSDSFSYPACLPAGATFSISQSSAAKLQSTQNFATTSFITYDISPPYRKMADTQKPDEDAASSAPSYINSEVGSEPSIITDFTAPDESTDGRGARRSNHERGEKRKRGRGDSR